MEQANTVNELFEIKQKFLRVIPHPKLIDKYIKQLEQKGQIQDKSNLRLDAIQLTKTAVATSLQQYLEDYITAELKMKFEIANASSRLSLRNYLVSLYKQNGLLLQKLNTYTAGLKSQAVEIKQSDPIDAYACLTIIKNNELTESGINTYLCTALDTTSDTTKKPLLAACLIAQKIIANYG